MTNNSSTRRAKGSAHRNFFSAGSRTCQHEARQAGAIVFNEPRQGYGACVHRALRESLTFQDTAFAHSTAAVVTNNSKSNYSITFLNPVLTYSSATFIESDANNGTVTDTATITLAGDTLTDRGRLTAHDVPLAVGLAPNPWTFTTGTAWTTTTVSTARAGLK